MHQDLQDVMPFDYTVTESESGRFRVEGVFQRSDVENANKRVYPRKLWEKELNEKRIQEAVQNRAMYGELDHPADGKTKLSRVAHVITDLQLQPDGIVVGAAEVLEHTPNGQILKALFEAGTQVGISSRGSGSVNNGIVGEDFKLNTFDFVARPSTPGALPTPPKTSKRATAEEIEDTGDFATEGSDEYDAVVDDPDFQRFLQSLDDGTREHDVLQEESPDINELGQEVLQLHNWLSDNANSLTPELQETAAEGVLALGTEVYGLLESHPEYHVVLDDLVNKIEESRELVFGLCTVDSEEIVEEATTMDRNTFITNRLYEAAENVEEERLAEAEALYSELDGLGDEELMELGLELGVIAPEDVGLTEEALYEDEDEEQEMLLDVDEEVAAYVEDLEDKLEEAVELISDMTQALEENDGVMAAKYEMALGVLQETIIHHQMLQEALGGEDRANRLVEAYVSKLEGDDADDDMDADGFTDDVNEDIEDIEALLGEAGDQMDETMARNVRLSEGALNRMGQSLNEDAN